MSRVFQNIDPTPPPLSDRLCCGGRGGHARRVERGGGGSIFWKMQGTALYSTYIESSLDPRISPHSGIWGAADEAVLNIERKK